MTRSEVEASYEIKHGVIVSPGKFEGEPVYVPAFWSAALEGMADEDDGEMFVFELGSDDYAYWPELANYSLLMLREADNGFVYSEVQS